MHHDHDHTMPHDHDHSIDSSQILTQGFWEERYSSAAIFWSGNPNAQLVVQTSDLVPGTALDVGCGEGADAIWLAARGWQVTGVDISTVALGRAAERAAEVGAEIASRTTWQQVDILSWEPAPQQFDLVSAHFMQLPGDAREAVHRRLAAAVRPGGTLLIVSHHPSDLETSAGRWNMPDFFSTGEQVAATLDPNDWQIIVVAAPDRQATDPEGKPVNIRDAVLRAVRRRCQAAGVTPGALA